MPWIGLYNIHFVLYRYKIQSKKVSIFKKKKGKKVSHLSPPLSLPLTFMLCLLTFLAHVVSPGSERQKGEVLSLISSFSDKVVPLNQYANDCAMAQNCQIGRNPLHCADENNKGEKVREQGEVGEDEVSLEEELME